MRSPVYRNLDRPFQIFGFSPLEVIALCVLFVLSGELTDVFGIHRVWSFLIALLFAFSMYFFRKALGDLFFRRLLRFLFLPSSTKSKIFITSRMK